MKQDVFNKIIEVVSNRCGVNKTDIFGSSRKRHIVDARFLVYYFAKKHMQVVYIQKYMNDNGSSVNHSNIIHGIRKTELQVSSDTDFQFIINKIQTSL